MPHQFPKNTATPIEERKRLLKRSDTLSDFGSITSLVSTAVYFLEQLTLKRIPRWLNTVSLVGVGAGIAAIFVSMRDKIKAGNVMEYTPNGEENQYFKPQQNVEKGPVETLSPKWAIKEQRKQPGKNNPEHNK